MAATNIKNNVYVGKLSDKTRERDLEDLFSKHGKIVNVSLKLGYGFVEFEDSRDADEAVKQLDNYDLDGSRIIVEHSRGPRERRDRDRGDRDRGDRDRDRDRDRDDRSSRDDYRSRSRRGLPPIRTQNRVIVDNISSSTNWRDLKDLIRDVSRISPTFADVFRDGYGVVEFENSDDMRRVIKDLDDYRFQGRKISLKEDKGSRSDRYEPYSRSSRRSRSRSRSPKRNRSASPRRSRSPEKRGRSPSPRKESRSPRKSSKSPEKNGRSHSRSRSRS